MLVSEPGKCQWEIPGCKYYAVALVQRYDDDETPPGAHASGAWRWLCGDHTALDLGYTYE